MSETLLVFGAGGSGREVAWLARECWPDRSVEFVVDRPAFLSDDVHGLPVRLLSDVAPGQSFVPALGDPAVRRRAVDACRTHGLNPLSLLHPRVERSPQLQVGEGVVVCAGSVLTVDVSLGDYVQVNVGCTVSHDVTLGAYTTLAPGVHVSGHVVVGEDVRIGTGASIVNGSRDAPLLIGDGATVAAGAVVIGAVAPGALVAGVPAVRKR